jgi:predicted MFS family arabinose efflux permease
MGDLTGTDQQSRRHGWIVIGAFALVAAATQLLWLTYAPITTGTAHHYRVSESAVGWLSEIFPLLYVVLAIPAGRVLDRSLHGGLATGALLTALGGLLRLLGDDFGWALAGQFVVAVAQPLVLNAITKLASERLPPEERAEGIAIGSAGMMVGMLLALVLGATLGGGRIHALLVIGAIFAVLAAGGLLAALRLPGAAPSTLATSLRRPLRAVWTDRRVRILAGLLFVGFGVFIALTTWLQALLNHYGVSASSAGRSDRESWRRRSSRAARSSGLSAPRSPPVSAAASCLPSSTCSPSTPSSSRSSGCSCSPTCPSSSSSPNGAPATTAAPSPR